MAPVTAGVQRAAGRVVAGDHGLFCGTVSLCPCCWSSWPRAGLSPLVYRGRSVILPSLVEAGEPANAVLDPNPNLVSLLGPALGGILVATVGNPPPSSSLPGATRSTWLCRRGIEGLGAPSSSSWQDDIRRGFRYAMTTPVLTLLFSLTYGPLEPVLPLLVSTVSHDGAQAPRLLWSRFAAGALVAVGTSRTPRIILCGPPARPALWPHPRGVGGGTAAGSGPRPPFMVSGLACTRLGAVVWTFDEASWQTGAPARDVGNPPAPNTPR